MTEVSVNSILASEKVDTRSTVPFLPVLRGRLRWGLNLIKEVLLISLVSITCAGLGAFGFDKVGWLWMVGGLIGAGVGSYIGTKFLIDRAYQKQ